MFKIKKKYNKVQLKVRQRRNVHEKKLSLVLALLLALSVFAAACGGKS